MLYLAVIINVIFEFMVEMILHTTYTTPNTFKNIGYRSLWLIWGKFHGDLMGFNAIRYGHTYPYVERIHETDIEYKLGL